MSQTKTLTAEEVNAIMDQCDLPVRWEGDVAVPFIPHIDAEILQAIEKGGQLEMGSWHTCNTTHCRAGWAIHLAGKAGYALEKKCEDTISPHDGAELAGALIYHVSRPGPLPDFFCGDSRAMEDIRRHAILDPLTKDGAPLTTP